MLGFSMFDLTVSLRWWHWWQLLLVCWLWHKALLGLQLCFHGSLKWFFLIDVFSDSLILKTLPSQLNINLSAWHANRWIQSSASNLVLMKLLAVIESSDCQGIPNVLSIMPRNDSITPCVETIFLCEHTGVDSLLLSNSLIFFRSIVLWMYKSKIFPWHTADPAPC